MASSEQFNTDATKKVLAPFGNQNSSLVNAIPLNASGGRVNEASWNGGFPSITTLPVGSGGKPPSGLDFNGIFNVLSNSIFNSQCGYNINEYNSDWATAVGGYPKGAIVWYPSGNDVDKKPYVSLIDNNLSEPNTSSWKIAGEVPQTIGVLGYADTPENNAITISNLNLSIDRNCLIIGWIGGYSGDRNADIRLTLDDEELIGTNVKDGDYVASGGDGGGYNNITVFRYKHISVGSHTLSISRSFNGTWGGLIVIGF